MKKVSKFGLTLILMLTILTASFVSADDIQSIKDNYLANLDQIYSLITDLISQVKNFLNN